MGNVHMNTSFFHVGLPSRWHSLQILKPENTFVEFSGTFEKDKGGELPHSHSWTQIRIPQKSLVMTGINPPKPVIDRAR